MRKRKLLNDLDLDFELDFELEAKYSEILPRCRVCKHYLNLDHHYCEAYHRVIFIEILGLCSEEDSFEEATY